MSHLELVQNRGGMLITYIQSILEMIVNDHLFQGEQALNLPKWYNNTKMISVRRGQNARRWR